MAGPVQWPENLLKAVITSYRELLPAHHYPVGLINLSLPIDKVLVNTAPDKQRVKFLDEKSVLSFVQQSIEQMLSTHSLAPVLPETFKPRKSEQRTPNGISISQTYWQLS